MQAEVSVNSHKTTRYHIPKDSNLHVQHHKNFKSHKITTVIKSTMHRIPDDGNRNGLWNVCLGIQFRVAGQQRGFYRFQSLWKLEVLHKVNTSVILTFVSHTSANFKSLLCSISCFKFFLSLTMLPQLDSLYSVMMEAHFEWWIGKYLHVFQDNIPGITWRKLRKTMKNTP
jgi:hypothetical protein